MSRDCDGPAGKSQLPSDLMDLIGVVLAPEGTEQWLIASNTRFDGRTPIEELELNGSGQARACLEAMGDGTFT